MAAVDEQVDFVLKEVFGNLRIRNRPISGSIEARCGQRTYGLQKSPQVRRGRTTNRERSSAVRRGDGLPNREHDGKRSGPETEIVVQGRRRSDHAQVFQLRSRRKKNWKRFALLPPFHASGPINPPRISRIRSESIVGIGWDRRDSASAEELSKTGELLQGRNQEIQWNSPHV